jgi:hypothetical protein
VYTGAVSNVLDYFARRGFPCPVHVNPADHLIDVATVDTRTLTAEAHSADRVNALLESWTQQTSPSPDTPLARTTTPIDPQIPDPGVSLFRQIWYLTTRNLRTTVRDPFGLGGFLFEGVFVGTLVGWTFYNIPRTLTGIRSMQGFIYSAIGMQGYLILLFTTWKVTVDMPVPPILEEGALT